MDKKALLALLAVVVCLFAGFSPAFADGPNGAITRDDVISFVDKAVDFAQANGKAKALSEFMNQSGPFVRGNLYIFAYDFKGNVLAHGGQPELVGKNLIERTDTDGKKIIRELMALAIQGSGWFRYNWEDRLTRKIGPKLGYVKKVDDTWWLGSGLYEDEMDQGLSFSVDARSALGLLISSADAQLEGVLSSLSIIAETSAAKSGDWKAIRPLLAAMAKTGASGAHFFVRPDGTYFTVEKGRQDKTLSDRPYFSDLMAGKDVTGSLVISKSTGLKSAVLGVPVKKDGRVIGALGASVFIEPLNDRLREAILLPSNQLFFAMDGLGRTALHQNRDFLFVYTSEMGSPSLEAAVKQMHASKEGTVQWDMGGLGRTCIFRKSKLNGWCYGIAELSEVKKDGEK
ncbi:MAG: cache domain-containing protein [Deltaproteobacteria bacterium]|nr:cache domain-containing protein [Deltaproteobacteria bacterium]